MVLRQQRGETSGSSPKHYQSFSCSREEKGDKPELHASKVLAVSVTFPDADIHPSPSSNVGSSALQAEGCRVPKKCLRMRGTARTQGPVKRQRLFSWHSWIRCQWVPNPSGTPLTAPLLAWVRGFGAGCLQGSQQLHDLAGCQFQDILYTVLKHGNQLVKDVALQYEHGYPKSSLRAAAPQAAFLYPKLNCCSILPPKIVGNRQPHLLFGNKTAPYFHFYCVMSQKLGFSPSFSQSHTSLADETHSSFTTQMSGVT